MKRAPASGRERARPPSPSAPSTPRSAKTRRARRTAIPARDMDASTFAPILADLVTRIPGAYAAVLVDREGETVDYAGNGDPFELKLAAAHWQIVLAESARYTASSGFGELRSLAVRGVRRSFLAHVLPEGYVLLVLLHRRAGFTPIHRAFSVCSRALIDEARWSPPPRPPASPRPTQWFAVTVTLGRAKRPVRVASLTAAHDVDVLGLMRGAGIDPRELGYRVRTASGLEFTLIREPGGFWYADEDVTIA